MIVLKVEEVSKRFGGITALDRCSLEVKRGTITALIGPNGSGKTTLFDVISQLIDEDAGKILFAGHDIAKHTPFSAYKVANYGISRTFQETRLFKQLTIKEHLLLAKDHKSVEMLKNIIGSKETVNELQEIEQVLTLVGLDKDRETKACDLSYGQRKLLDLAMAIIKPHTMLLLDEPVAGVNPRLRESIKAILKTLRKNGETILLIEHDMNFTMELADYIYVLDAGKVIAQGKPAAVRKNPVVLEAYLGD